MHPIQGDKQNTQELFILREPEGQEVRHCPDPTQTYNEKLPLQRVQFVIDPLHYEQLLVQAVAIPEILT